MPQSVHSGGSGSLSHHRFVHVVLLSRETVVIPVENKNTKVQDIFTRTCDIVNLRETDFFGLAQLKENEFQFLQRDLKISKLTSKIWKCKDAPLDEPLQTFYLRVQYYVENIGLLREKATRLQYYLQMRDNLLHYGQLVAEEKCFLLAAYALQADFGNYVADRLGNDYFDPRQYFPSSVVMRHGQDFITTHLPVMHSSMAGISPAEAMVNYVRELSTTPHEHNFHFYKMRKRKYDTATVAWVAICPAGLKIYEESDGFRSPVTTFRWPDIGKLNFEKKKFEIISEGTSGPKYTFYFDCKDWAEYIVDLCRQVHQFHLMLQPRLAELQHFHAQSPSFCEKYVYSENSEGTPNHHQSLSWVSRDGREHAVQSGASNDSSAFGRPKESDDQEGQEIFITTPPSLISNIGSPRMLPHRLKSFESCDSEKLQERGGLPQKRLFYVSGSNGNSREVEYSVDGIPAAFASYSVPASSSESLTVLPFTKADSFQRARSQLLNFSATGSVTPSQASSALTTPSQCSASPSSSAGSSGHLPLSLPISRDVYDAAVLRKSLPHGVHFNDYLQKLWSGQDPVASGSTSAQWKTSFDHLQMSQNSFVEPVQRSSSLRQPLVSLGENRKGSDSLSQDECELLVMRSNSDKTPKSSKLTLLSKFLGPKPMPRQQDTRETPSPFALPTGPVVVGRSDNGRSQNLSLFTASSDQLMSLSSNDSSAVARSDSNKSQKSVNVSPSYQASVMLLSDSGKSPKAGLSLPSDTYQREEEHSVVQKKEDGRFASGHPYPIVPVEAQIQKLVFGPTMTAVSTPVRPVAEKPVGNLPTVSYQSPYTYIPNSFPVSVIGPSSRPGAGILSVPCQDVDIPSDHNCGSPCSGHAENKSFPSACTHCHLSDQTAGTAQVGAGESVDDYHERPAPPPYGATHSTISSIRFQNPLQAPPQQLVSTPVRQMTPAASHHSQVTVARPFPADAPARQPLPKPDPMISSVAGKRELSSWMMINDGKSSVQVQAHSSTYNVDQDDQCNTRQEKSTVENRQLKKLSEVLHDEQSIGDDKTSDISDCRPDYHDPQCPCHGVNSDIRERLRSLMPSVPPMLNALLTDKSLHSTSCTCPGDRRAQDASLPSDPLNPSALSAQRNSHKLRYFPDLSLESEATMIINGTLSLNGTYELEEIDDESGRRAFLSRKVRHENGKLVMHHLSDSDQIPRQKVPFGHNQSNSDSAAQSFVSSKC